MDSVATQIAAKKSKLEELRRARVAREQELKKSKQDATTGTGTIGTSNREAIEELEIDIGKYLTQWICQFCIIIDQLV